MAAITNSWIEFRQPLPKASLKLFCFPYAGGSAALYRTWQGHLPPSIEVCPVQLPGRARRLGEALLLSIPEMVEATAEGLRSHLAGPFAFFGYSMGALLGFELARLLQAQKRTPPLSLIVAGSRAPHLQALERSTYELPDAEFLQELRTINGTPREILDDPEAMQLLLPIIRADFKAIQTYRYEPGPKVNCPIAAFGGLEDNYVESEHVRAWQEYTSADFSYSMLPGDHFFINQSLPAVLREVHLSLFPIINSLPYQSWRANT